MLDTLLIALDEPLLASHPIEVSPAFPSMAIDGASADRSSIARIGFANAKTPFLAGTKYPSRHASAHSLLPWASNRLNNARQIRSHVPCLDQAQKRHQQVAGEPSPCCTSSRVYPVFNRQRMPLSVVRSSLRFRPGPDRCFGIKGSITAQGSAVASYRLLPTV